MINPQIAAQRLKALRESKRLSHQKLSELLEERGTEVSAKSLMNYESAAKDEFHTKSQSISKMNASTLVALAEFFNVSTDYLLGLHDAPTADIKVQAIHDYTGLTVNSISLLQHHAKVHVSSPLEMDDFMIPVDENGIRFDKAEEFDTCLLAAINLLIEEFSYSGFFEQFLSYIFSDDIKIAKDIDFEKFFDNQVNGKGHNAFTNIVFLRNMRISKQLRPVDINQTTTEAVAMLILQNTLKKVKIDLFNRDSNEI